MSMRTGNVQGQRERKIERETSVLPINRLIQLTQAIFDIPSRGCPSSGCEAGPYLARSPSLAIDYQVDAIDFDFTARKEGADVRLSRTPRQTAHTHATRVPRVELALRPEQTFGVLQLREA